MKKIIIVGIIIVLIVIGSIVIFSKKDNNSQTTGELTNTELEMNDSGKYMVTNIDGEEIEVDSEAEALWYFEHPDYNPEPVHVEGDESIDVVEYDFSENVE